MPYGVMNTTNDSDSIDNATKLVSKIFERIDKERDTTRFFIEAAVQYAKIAGRTDEFKKILMNKFKNDKNFDINNFCSEWGIQNDTATKSQTEYQRDRNDGNREETIKREITAKFLRKLEPLFEKYFIYY